MKKIHFYTIALVLTLANFGAGSVTAQTSVGIGTATPDANAVLDITSTTKGVLFPRLTAVQQTTLAGMLGSAETGMIIIDATTGVQKNWTGSAWATVAASSPVTAASPLSVATNNIKLNAGTNAGDLLTWDGTNWINSQPAIQHFNINVDNHQPYLVNNYIISAFGVYPSQNDASTPYVGEIYLMGCNFTITGFFACDGSLLPISQYSILFNLIGTTYGGNGTSTFALPDLRGRVPVGQGTGAGLSTYIIGQSGGAETKAFVH